MNKEELDKLFAEGERDLYPSLPRITGPGEEVLHWLVEGKFERAKKAAERWLSREKKQEDESELKVSFWEQCKFPNLEKIGHSSYRLIGLTVTFDTLGFVRFLKAVKGSQEHLEELDSLLKKRFGVPKTEMEKRIFRGLHPGEKLPSNDERPELPENLGRKKGVLEIEMSCTKRSELRDILTVLTFGEDKEVKKRIEKLKKEKKELRNAEFNIPKTFRLQPGYGRYSNLASGLELMGEETLLKKSEADPYSESSKVVPFSKDRYRK